MIGQDSAEREGCIPCMLCFLSRECMPSVRLACPLHYGQGHDLFPPLLGVASFHQDKASSSYPSEADEGGEPSSRLRLASGRAAGALAGARSSMGDSLLLSGSSTSASRPRL